jgi:transcriptional regulator with XRE-family HTH domain
MTSASMLALRERLKLTRMDLAKKLGISRNTLALYEAGRAEIPRTVALACAALAFGLPEME